MKAFIEYVVKALVDFPDQVDIRQVDGERTMVYELRLNKADIGKVIGKQGRTIQALRTLVNGAGGKTGKRAMVEIIEEKIAADQTPEALISSELPPSSEAPASSEVLPSKESAQPPHIS